MEEWRGYGLGLRWGRVGKGGVEEEWKSRGVMVNGRRFPARFSPKNMVEVGELVKGGYGVGLGEEGWRRVEKRKNGRVERMWWRGYGGRTKLKVHNIPLSDDYVIYAALYSLPPEFSQIKIAYNTQEETWSINSLISKCVAEEEKLKKEKSESAYLVSGSKFHSKKGKEKSKNSNSLAAKKDETFKKSGNKNNTGDGGGDISRERVDRLIKDQVLPSLDYSDMGTCIDCARTLTDLELLWMGVDIVSSTSIFMELLKFWSIKIDKFEFVEEYALDKAGYLVILITRESEGIRIRHMLLKKFWTQLEGVIINTSESHSTISIPWLDDVDGYVGISQILTMRTLIIQLVFVGLIALMGSTLPAATDCSL
ncbi:UBN2 domain-containing protein [Senna tora]|uniref:UBN2 domain-containing protein n=1 Tax=Senna tora TaxID=362788 RepID=A0A834T1H9_9FABA|nr:UBN2 domain-containing protein [Senna tora]